MIMLHTHFTAKELAVKLIAALHAQGLLNEPTYKNILAKYT